MKLDACDLADARSPEVGVRLQRGGGGGYRGGLGGFRHVEGGSTIERQEGTSSRCMNEMQSKRVPLPSVGLQVGLESGET